MKHRAFMTIEVLIALVIISMGVLTITSALKTLYSSTDKQKYYENSTIALLSIKDTLIQIDFEKQKRTTGKLNGLDYTITADQIASQRTYVVDESSDLSGNKGGYEIILYKITLTLSDTLHTKYYTLYQARTKKLFDDTNEF